MIGTIIGDIAGSRFEFDNHKSKDFEIFHEKSRFTDDSVMTIAIGKALMDWKEGAGEPASCAVAAMKSIGRRYENCGYGRKFREWLLSEDTQPYNSYGNGAAMRVSACAYVAKSIEEVKLIARDVTAVTHNHPEAIKGAEAVAVSGYMALSGCSKEEIKKYIQQNYYALDFTIDEIRSSYTFDVSCQGSVPQAIEAFLEASDFEDAVRTAVSLGGDSDTLAAIAGGIAEAFWGVPSDMKERALLKLSDELKKLLLEFEEKYKR